MPEQNDLTLLRGKFGNARIQDLGYLSALELRIDRRKITRERIPVVRFSDLGGVLPLTPSAKMVERRISGDAQHPGQEFALAVIGCPFARKCTTNADERLLKQIVGGGWPNHSHQIPVHALLVSLHEVPEGGFVTTFDVLGYKIFVCRLHCPINEAVPGIIAPLENYRLKIVNWSPGRMVLDVRLFHCLISATETPCRPAIPISVSPRRTVYVSEGAISG